MGISRDSLHKRRATGGKKKPWHKKRKYDLGRQPGNTKLSAHKTVRRLRVRGGAFKFRALRLDTGNYSWGTESVTRKTRILDVAYNASNNELVRTQTLVKNAIVQVDAAPFRQWYAGHYGVDLGRAKKNPQKEKEKEKGSAGVTGKKKAEGEEKEGEENAEAKVEGDAALAHTTSGGEGEEASKKKSSHVARKVAKRQQGRKLDPHLEEQFAAGRLYACISSRPGQCGRADGYILEGRELEFYLKKMQKKKGKGAGAA